MGSVTTFSTGTASLFKGVISGNNQGPEGRDSKGGSFFETRKKSSDAVDAKSNKM